MDTVELARQAYRSFFPKQLIFRDLPVIYPEGDRQAYRIVQVRPVGFHMFCSMQREHACPNWIATIVLPAFAMSANHREKLPPGVPWLQASKDIDEQLRLLRMILVDPLEAKTWPCVDAMDYAAALSRGGELRLFEVSGGSATHAIESLGEALQQCRPGRSVCVQVHVPSNGNGLQFLDQVGSCVEIEWDLDDDGLVIYSAMPAEADEHRITVMVNG